MKKKYLAFVVITLVVVMLGYIVFGNEAKPNYDEFAQCLTENGAVMYGVYWCKYCNLQKKEFGSSFKYINYVECSEEPDECTEKDIQGFPTWIINGIKYEGKQPLQKLSSLTECKLEGGESNEKNY